MDLSTRRQEIQQRARGFTESFLSDGTGTRRNGHHNAAQHQKIREQVRNYRLGAINHPEEVGGQGYNIFEECLLNEEIGKSTGGLWNHVWQPPLCLRDATALQKRTCLVPACAGEIYIPYSISEPTGGSDAAGGVESMTRAPFVIPKSESAFSRSANIFDTVIGPRFSNPRQVSAYGDHQMPETGDFVASELGIERADCDLFALNSQQRYATAKSAGYFDAEVSPVLLTDRKGKPSSVSEDEHPRPSATLEGLASFSSLYEGGVVTAGNASGVNDGAAAIFLGSRSLGKNPG
ncbi:acyl-CoA dehydrogenase family protein [Mesorhizobium australicum]|uniref:thiolase family protein n=1 Tax=Mesorhizobium australicum TaxID=536018 RepID=UPI00333C7A77